MTERVSEIGETEKRLGLNARYVTNAGCLTDVKLQAQPMASLPLNR